jgi:hypothetical protein
MAIQYNEERYQCDRVEMSGRDDVWELNSDQVNRIPFTKQIQSPLLKRFRATDKDYLLQFSTRRIMGDALARPTFEPRHRDL